MQNTWFWWSESAMW